MAALSLPPPQAVPMAAFEGYACLFDQVDLGRDAIAPGAFADTLARRGAAGVRLLYQHDPAEPIGVWARLAEDALGLKVEGRLTLDVARAREAAALIAAGALDGLSIGFKAVEARTDPRTRVRRITRIDLWEVSIVTFPMQPGARIRRPDALALPAAPPPAPLTTRQAAAAVTRAAARLRPHLALV
ncbi:HK97 family phage prohead protease [Azorhizobium doebereinerae]|uniref:HK97 family phage prohead protease n=1 Tax=Azorhizobium doebereinerae TaxID=281091 RepID=UPI000405D55F|nr:HK97 family phage prohead protease [Azorhizobium doebereinerae]